MPSRAISAVTPTSESMNGRLLLESRKFVAANPDRVFRAWTDPVELAKWWGPAGVRCIAAEIDLRVGGIYRIGNELPDKTVIWIAGVFERIERPNLLVYTWSTDAQSPARELVTVRMNAQADGTEVIVTHERIESQALRDRHAEGWAGCLDGLASYLTSR
jgi:uncharacterized protein YndB with AHSA1/START domain